MPNHSTLTTDTVLPGWTGEVDRDLLWNFLGDLDLSDSEDDDPEDELDEDADLMKKIYILNSFHAKTMMI